MADLHRPEDNDFVTDIEKTWNEDGDSFMATDHSLRRGGHHRVASSSLMYLPLRILRILIKDPAAFLFLVSLLSFAICMPFLGMYLKSTDKLLDLDSMEVSGSSSYSTAQNRTIVLIVPSIVPDT